MTYILEHMAISKIIWSCSFSNILNTRFGSNNNPMKQINILSGKQLSTERKEFNTLKNISTLFISDSYHTSFILNTLPMLEYDLVYSGWGKT